jgi:DNA-binding NarL/FixJ family response regulator
MTVRAGDVPCPRKDLGVRSRPPQLDSSVVALAETYLRVGHLTFAVATTQMFDYRAFAAVLPLLPDVELVQCVTDLAEAAMVCKKLRPDGIIIDVAFANGSAFTTGRELLESGAVQTVAYFDVRFAVWRAYQALSSWPSTRYFTRDFDPSHFCLRMRTGQDSSDTSFIVNLQQLTRFDTHGVLSLTEQEVNIAQWLAWGHNVRGAAEKLGLAESTIDNHKSRAMKKLNVHRTADLVRIAIETGLVD